MKKHLKKLRPLLLLTTLFLLTNCQEEFEEHEHVNSQDSGMKIITKPFNYFKNLPGLIDKTISKRLHKTDDSKDVYNFDIDSTKVMEITTDYGKFYTMLITRDFDYPLDMFENLVICDRDSVKEAYIISYAPDAEYYERLETTAHAPFIGGMWTTKIDYKTLQKDAVTICTETTIAYCGNGEPGTLAGPGCYDNKDKGKHVFTKTFIRCKTWILPVFADYPFNLSFVNINPGGASGNGNGDGSGSGYDPGYNPGDSPEPGSNSPSAGGTIKPGLYGPVTGPMNPNKNCEALKKIAETPVINTSLNTLKGFVHTSNNERLFTFDKNGSGGTYVTPEVVNTGQSASFRLKTSTYGIAHIHQKGPAANPSGLYEMFSFSDLRNVYLFAKNFSGSGVTSAPLFFNMMVIDGYTYAVMPNNVGEFKNLDYIFDDPKKVATLDWKLESLYLEIGSPSVASHTQLAQAFLLFMSNLGGTKSGTNFNISLYRIENGNNHYGTWEKLELDPSKNNTLKEPIPCK
jgi:hypothetical protein